MRNVFFGHTGLENMGNSCYLNSVIQCLSNTVFLKNYITNSTFKKEINHKSQREGKIMIHFSYLISALWVGTYGSLRPYGFKQAIGLCEEKFLGNAQQDAHEFLTILLDLLNKDLKSSLRGDDQGTIYKLFNGQYKSTIKCRTCGTKSEPKCEPFLGLSLNLPNQRSTLKKCLDTYFSESEITWACPKCKKNQDSIKMLDITKSPLILVIHLNRNETGLSKKQTFVSFPWSLNLEPYISHKHKNNSYNLYAVSNHIGESVNAGHYTSYCKNSISGNWLQYDDTTVSVVRPQEIQSSAAYILFYTTN